MKKQELLTGEKIREMIHIETERLKFVQIFFLPLTSGLIALNFTDEQVSVKIILNVLGGVSLLFLTLKRKRIIRLAKKWSNKL